VNLYSKSSVLAMCW